MSKVRIDLLKERLVAEITSIVDRIDEVELKVAQQEKEIQLKESELQVLSDDLNHTKQQITEQESIIETLNMYLVAYKKDQTDSVASGAEDMQSSDKLALINDIKAQKDSIELLHHEQSPETLGETDEIQDVFA